MTDATTQDEVKGAFEGRDCPCGSDKPGANRLYCDDCINSMVEDQERGLNA